MSSFPSTNIAIAIMSKIIVLSSKKFGSVLTDNTKRIVEYAIKAGFCI